MIFRKWTENAPEKSPETGKMLLNRPPGLPGSRGQGLEFSGGFGSSCSLTALISESDPYWLHFSLDTAIQENENASRNLLLHCAARRGDGRSGVESSGSSAQVSYERAVCPLVFGLTLTLIQTLAQKKTFSKVQSLYKRLSFKSMTAHIGSG